jgi:hypothetical protein
MKLSSVSFPLDYMHPYWKDNFKFLKGYIMQSLGHPIIRIELSETMLIQGIHDAIAQYFKYGGDITSIDFELVNLTEGNIVTIPDHIEKNLIKDVVFSENSNAFGFINPIDEGVYATLPMSSFLNINGGTLELGQYYMARQQLEDANLITGRKRTWEFIGDQIRIFPGRITAEISAVGILYGKIPLPEVIESDDWVRRYSVSSAKIMLGTIRRKFSGFAAAGGQGGSDGSELVNEGKQEQTDLIQELKDARPSIRMLQE